MRFLYLIFSLLLWQPSVAEEPVKQGEFLGAKTIEAFPNWFKTTFMDFSEDIEEADDENRHVMIYFHQNGCPYCAKLVEDNFHDQEIVAKLQKDFDVIETNMWGDRDLTDWTGKEFSEKEFSAHMRVQFTPTLIFLDNKGKILLRLNGYQSIDKMHTTLDYISNKVYLNQSYASYVSSLKKDKKETKFYLILNLPLFIANIKNGGQHMEVIFYQSLRFLPWLSGLTNKKEIPPPK